MNDLALSNLEVELRPKSESDDEGEAVVQPRTQNAQTFAAILNVASLSDVFSAACMASELPSVL